MNLKNSKDLSKEKILTCYPDEELNFEGRLLGGCLDILILLCGTKYDNLSNFTEKYKDNGGIDYIDYKNISSKG